MIYVGLMSGTSIDGIDAAVVSFERGCELLASHSHDVSNTLRDRIVALAKGESDNLQLLGEVDHQLGLLFADAANTVIAKAGLKSADVTAIGSHGQTVRHSPPPNRFPYSLQIADPNLIAAQTGCTVVADFRRKDIAVGGQGAPLAPMFHHYAFSHEREKRAVVNLGGIANVTLLLPGQPVTGWDTGPANGLMDQWIQQTLNKPYDHNGEWASSGKLSPSLLRNMLTEPFFAQPAPKSTGRELFNLTWLKQQTMRFPGLPAEDIQATLLELTAQSIHGALKNFALDGIYLAGGGVHNLALHSRLGELFTPIAVMSSDVVGVHPDWVEAICFAYLAKLRLEGKTANLPGVTGGKSAVLGGVYLP